MVILLFFVNTVSISSLNFVIISAAAVHLVLASTTGLGLYNRPRPLQQASSSTSILSLYTHPQLLHPSSASTSSLSLHTYPRPQHSICRPVLFGHLFYFVNTVSISSLNCVIISAAAVHLVLASSTGLVLYIHPPSLSLYIRPYPLLPSTASAPSLSLYSSTVSL